MIGLTLSVSAQRPMYGKMSPYVRQLARKAPKSPSGTFLMRIADGADDVLTRHGGRSLARFGNIHVVSLPLKQLGPISHDARVLRIEANRMNKLLNDSMPLHLNATKAHEGIGLPQAFTGKGVVVGVMDVGFDLTHPTFYSRDTTDYRIRRLWDMISADTIGSELYVGRDYRTKEELLQLGCCRDGRDNSHGTHTTGTAAGSGYDSKYGGMAPESDICLVANAVSDDIAYIDSADVYKYTFATDALGFKYIFDYADAVDKPCVISFSEGSMQDFWGYDQLYYEMLDSLVGPGRIIVASAGNDGHWAAWFPKPAGQLSEGTFLYNSSKNAIVTLKSRDDFDVRFIRYDNDNDTIQFKVSEVLAQEDSVLNIVTRTYDDTHTLVVQAEAYKSCYIPEETCYDITITSDEEIGRRPLAFEVIGKDADVEVYRNYGVFITNGMNTALRAGEFERSILSPSSSPNVISVGATMRRQGVINYKGVWKTYEEGPGQGERCRFSSIGPTFDGRIKPDVMAPGVNIISSYSSYYLENHPDASDIAWDVKHFDFNNRTYAWNSDSGTSMSCPAVAGAIALWLQANPNLTPSDVLGVIARTSRQYDPSLTYPNNEYGYGEIDVYAGLLDILSFNKIEEVSSVQSAVKFTVDNGQLTLTLPQESDTPLRLRVYSVNGICLTDMQLPANQTEHRVPLNQLSKGIYAVQIDGAAQFCGSSLIRL